MTITDEMIDAACAAASDYKRTDQLQTHQNIMRAALTAVLPMMDGWQPIETAPKDGTGVLTCEHHAGYPESIRVCWWVVDQYDGDYWQDDADSEPTPTHWRPLPPPPKGDGT